MSNRDENGCGRMTNWQRNRTSEAEDGKGEGQGYCDRGAPEKGREHRVKKKINIEKQELVRGTSEQC